MNDNPADAPVSVLYDDAEKEKVYSPPPAPKRVPLAGEVWTHHSGTRLTVVWVDDRSVVYTVNDDKDRDVADVAAFSVLYDPPKAKLPPSHSFFNISDIDNRMIGYGWPSKSSADANANNTRVGILHMWVDDDGEPHVERVS